MVLDEVTDVGLVRGREVLDQRNAADGAPEERILGAFLDALDAAEGLGGSHAIDGVVVHPPDALLADAVDELGLVGAFLDQPCLVKEGVADGPAARG